MMKIFDIYIAFVSWGSGGKRRPVLIIEEYGESVTVFNITTRYEDKSKAIKEKYVAIVDWRRAGLNKQSYVDTNATIKLPFSAIDSQNPIGTLSPSDEERLIEFVSRQTRV
jgi:hypothetical protein